MTRTLWTLLGIFLFACSSTPVKTNAAFSECLNPKNNAPQFSFTLASYGPGTMDQQCHSMIQRGMVLGFTAISLVPGKIFDGQKIIPNGTIDDAELTRCLDEVWNSGLDLVYQPHLESDFILYPSHPNVWRADFDVVPDDVYFQNSFGAFFQWLSNHKKEIAAGQKHVDIVVSAELEKSTTLYGAQWAQFTSDLRAKLTALGLAGNIHLGFDPNWYPQPSFPISGAAAAASCKGFQNFVSALDYVAPSFYGDWSRMMKADGTTPAGATQVDDLKGQLMTRLSLYPASKCKVPQILGKDFSIGEFGVGGDFAHTEQGQWAMAQSSDFVVKRRAVYSNIIEWAKLQSMPPARPFPATINLWTGGVFDPVGVNPPSPDGNGIVEQIPDAEIAKQLQDYRAWRCGSAD